MTEIAVHYMPKYPPILPKAKCDCSGPNALVIGNRIVSKGRKNSITCDAILCMACGTIKPMAAEFDHYHDALAHFWAEWGWTRAIGIRLKEFADLSTSNDFESFCALRSGMSPKELKAYLEKRSERPPKEPTAKRRRRRTS